MARFISLVSFTDQGARNVKDSPARADAFRKMAEGLGVKVHSMFWTLGNYDLVVTVEGPEDSVTAALLKVSSAGNVHTHTMRAYDATEFAKVLSMVP
jgi:uncharacterized protein with GYD domain